MTLTVTQTPSPSPSPDPDPNPNPNPNPNPSPNQATQPNGLLPLLRAPRAVLVGDPMQLPPTVLGAEASAEARARTHADRHVGPG